MRPAHLHLVERQPALCGVGWPRRPRMANANASYCDECKSLALSATVTCDCGSEMSAARLMHPLLGGLCAACVKDSKAARPEAPMYETDAWSRGVRL